MQVLVKKSILDQLLNQLVEERSFHSRKYDQIAGDDKPVLPDAQMAMQLSKSGEPVNDPDFLPVNKQQLSNAASQLAMTVEPAKIQKFYSGLKKLIRKTGEKNQYKGMSETDLMERLAPIITKLISEAEDDEDIASSGFGIPKRRTDKSKMSDAEVSKERDLVRAALKHAAQGADQTLASVQSRQDAAIRRALGVKPRYPGADDDEYNRRRPLPAEPSEDDETSVFDINPRPTLGPVELSDRTIGDANRIIDALEAKGIPVTDMKLRIGFSVDDGRLIIKFKQGNESDMLYKTEYSLNGESLPFTTDQYKKSLISQLKLAVKSPHRNKEKPPRDEDTTTSSKDTGLTDEDIYYKGLQDFSVETGIPFGSLKNLGSDLAYIFGKRTSAGVNSPTELSKERLDLYNDLGQNIYDSFIKKAGRKKSREEFSQQSDVVKANFLKALPTADTSSDLKFDELVFENDYVEFLNSEKAKKEEIVELIDSCIKAYLKSDNFSKDFPEFSGFRAGEDGFTSLKNVSKTEERLGIRDANSLARFVAGFDLLRDEMVGRCLDYLITLTEGGTPAVAGIIEIVKDDLDAMLNQNPKTGKWALKEDLATTIDNIKELADISSYIEPSFDTLLTSIDQSLKRVPAGLVKKRNKVIEDVINSYINAFK